VARSTMMWIRKRAPATATQISLRHEALRY
jgi:hypothetical protein